MVVLLVLDKSQQPKQSLSVPQELSDRIITSEEFMHLLALTESLQKYDEKKNNTSLQKSIEDRCEIGDSKMTLGIAADVMKEMGYSSEYFERAVKLRYPSREQMVADLNEHGAKPSFEIIVTTYENKLLQALQIALPTQRPTVQHTQNPLIHTLTYYELANAKDASCSKKKKECSDDALQELASARVSNSRLYATDNKFDLSLILKNPLFLRCCGETIKQLNAQFKELLDDYAVIYDYSVE